MAPSRRSLGQWRCARAYSVNWGTQLRLYYTVTNCQCIRTTVPTLVCACTLIHATNARRRRRANSDQQQKGNLTFGFHSTGGAFSAKQVNGDLWFPFQLPFRSQGYSWDIPGICELIDLRAHWERLAKRDLRTHRRVPRIRQWEFCELDRETYELARESFANSSTSFANSSMSFASCAQRPARSSRLDQWHKTAFDLFAADLLLCCLFVADLLLLIYFKVREPSNTSSDPSTASTSSTSSGAHDLLRW